MDNTTARGRLSPARGRSSSSPPPTIYKAQPQQQQQQQLEHRGAVAAEAFVC